VPAKFKQIMLFLVHFRTLGDMGVRKWTSCNSLMERLTKKTPAQN